MRQLMPHEARTEEPLEQRGSEPQAAVAPPLLLRLQRTAGNRAVAALVAGATLQRHCENVVDGPLTGKAGRAGLGGGNTQKIVAKVKAHWATLETGVALHGGGGGHGAGGANATLNVPGTGAFAGNTDSSHHAEALAINSALNAGVAFPVVGSAIACNMDCCYMCTVLCGALGISVPAKDGKKYPSYFIPGAIWTNAALRAAFIGGDADLMYQHLGESARASFRSGIVQAALYDKPL